MQRQIFIFEALGGSRSQNHINSMMCPHLANVSKRLYYSWVDMVTSLKWKQWGLSPQTFLANSVSAPKYGKPHWPLTLRIITKHWSSNILSSLSFKVFQKHTFWYKTNATTIDETSGRQTVRDRSLWLGSCHSTLFNWFCSV